MLVVALIIFFLLASETEAALVELHSCGTATTADDAIPDDGIDDSGCFQAAIDSVDSSAPGGRKQDVHLHIAPGNWIVNQSLVWDGEGNYDNLSITGEGRASRLSMGESAVLMVVDADRWDVSSFHLIKMGGTTVINHLLHLNHVTAGTMHNIVIEGSGLAAGLKMYGASANNKLDNLRFAGLTGTSSTVRGVGIEVDHSTGGMDNKITNITLFPSAGAVCDSMLAIVGQTAGYFIMNVDSNPPASCWTLDIEGLSPSQPHRESQLVNIGTALATGTKGAIRIVNGENIISTGLIVEGNGSWILNHLVDAHCLACKFIGSSFNAINTQPGYDFFHPTQNQTIQFIGNTATRSTIGREFIYQWGADEVANRIFP